MLGKDCSFDCRAKRLIVCQQTSDTTTHKIDNAKFILQTYQFKRVRDIKYFCDIN